MTHLNSLNNINNITKKQNKKTLTIIVPSLQELMKKDSPVARQSFVRGNASGIHGGAKPRYGKRDRQESRREFLRSED